MRRILQHKYIVLIKNKKREKIGVEKRQIGSCQFYATTTKKNGRPIYKAILVSYILVPSFILIFIHSFPFSQFSPSSRNSKHFFFFLFFLLFLCLEVNNNPWSASSSFNGSSSFAIGTRHTISILSRPWFFFFIASFRHHLGKVPMIMNFLFVFVFF